MFSAKMNPPYKNTTNTQQHHTSLFIHLGTIGGHYGQFLYSSTGGLTCPGVHCSHTSWDPSLGSHNFWVGSGVRLGLALLSVLGLVGGGGGVLVSVLGVRLGVCQEVSLQVRRARRLGGGGGGGLGVGLPNGRKVFMGGLGEGERRLRATW